MNIQKQIKKEDARMTRSLLTSLLVMVLLPYMVYVLNNGGVFSGWELYFALGCVASIDVLLAANIIKAYDELYLNYGTYGRKLKVREGLFHMSYMIPFDKIIYIDVLEKKKLDVELVILFKRGKEKRKYIHFNVGFVKQNQQYKGIYDHLLARDSLVDYHCVIVQKGGSKKYSMLYLIFKNAYSSELSTKALDNVKKFMDEYNVS